VLEAKPAGYALNNVELQADRYASGLPAGLNPPVNPLPFLYLQHGRRDALHQRPRSRPEDARDLGERGSWGSFQRRLPARTHEVLGFRHEDPR
jgi:hypothetical protein